MTRRDVDEAHALIDYLLKPEVAAKNSNFISYANGNLASQKFIDKSILDDRTIYPDAATMAKLYTIIAHDQKTQRLVNRLWTRIKTGNMSLQHLARSLAAFAALHTTAFDRHLRCSQSHCSGCSRTQSSITDGDRLHGAGDVDAAVGVAWRLDRIGDLAPEAVAVGQPHHAHAVDRTFGLPGKDRDQRIGEAAAAEEGHRTPFA